MQYDTLSICNNVSLIDKAPGNLVDNIHLEGSVSQISYLGLGFYFMLKSGKHFAIFVS